jgi:2-iminobutanoate/2-iminopropanoate deaminase
MEESYMTPGTLSTSKAPAPVGAYSQGRRIGRLIQTCGQLPKDIGVGEDIEGQTTQVLEQLATLLSLEGVGWEDVLMLRVFLADDKYWDGMDAAFRAVLREPFPPRTSVSAGLAPGILVEIDALALIP